MAPTPATDAPGATINPTKNSPAGPLGALLLCGFGLLLCRGGFWLARRASGKPASTVANPTITHHVRLVQRGADLVGLVRAEANRHLAAMGDAAPLSTLGALGVENKRLCREHEAEMARLGRTVGSPKNAA